MRRYRWALVAAAVVLLITGYLVVAHPSTHPTAAQAHFADPPTVAGRPPSRRAAPAAVPAPAPRRRKPPRPPSPACTAARTCRRTTSGTPTSATCPRWRPAPHT